MKWPARARATLRLPRTRRGLSFRSLTSCSSPPPLSRAAPHPPSLPSFPPIRALSPRPRHSASSPRASLASPSAFLVAAAVAAAAQRPTLFPANGAFARPHPLALARPFACAYLLTTSPSPATAHREEPASSSSTVATTRPAPLPRIPRPFARFRLRPPHATMRAPSTSTLQQARTTAYPKRRSPAAVGASSSQPPSPSARRSSPTSVEMQRAAQLSPAERQLLPLLEREYRDDVRTYMFEMQVRAVSLLFVVVGALRPITPAPCARRTLADPHAPSPSCSFARAGQDDGQRRPHRPAARAAVVHALVPRRLPRRDPPPAAPPPRDALPRAQHRRPLRLEAHRLQEALPARRVRRAVDRRQVRGRQGPRADAARARRHVLQRVRRARLRPDGGSRPPDDRLGRRAPDRRGVAAPRVRDGLDRGDAHPARRALPHGAHALPPRVHPLQPVGRRHGRPPPRAPHARQASTRTSSLSLSPSPAAADADAHHVSLAAYRRERRGRAHHAHARRAPR